jgi:multidrug efflux system membrane fusion protein
MNRGALQVALRLGAVGLCAVAAIAAVKAWSAQHAPAAQEDAAAAQPIPAVTAKAIRQDVAIYATGIGEVQAYQSVLVRARVDGTLAPGGRRVGDRGRASVRSP